MSAVANQQPLAPHYGEIHNLRLLIDWLKQLTVMQHDGPQQHGLQRD